MIGRVLEKCIMEENEAKKFKLGRALGKEKQHFVPIMQHINPWVIFVMGFSLASNHSRFSF
jgi:hypothetical protein